MAKKLKKFLKSFTLIELIIVIAVIAVLGASAFLMLSQWMSKSRDSRKIADLGTIDTAISISITSNDKLPTPDNLTKVMFSGNRIWDVGYFGDEAVEEIGGALTKTPIDPTTKERYRYAQWANKKYQLGTIIENEQFSKYISRAYAQKYFTKLQGNYNQTIIVAKIDNVDTILPVPSLIVDKYEGEEKVLGEEHFWTNKSSYNLGGNQSTKLKVQSLYSGDISKLSDTTSTEFTLFINNFEKVYTGTNFVNVLNNNQSEDEIKVAVAQELSKVSSQPVSVLFLTCEGYNHGAKVDFYKQETVGFGDSCDSIKAQFECNNGNWIGENKSEYTKTSCNVNLPAQCDGNDHGTVKDFYSVDSVSFGQNCNSNLKSFTCENGVWKDGENNGDTITYQYSSCVVGDPIDCTATNIVKKSLNNLDITFDIAATLHGQSFEKAKIITENNGTYEYTLVGDCSNGTYQEVNLSEPVNKGCNEGYDQVGNSCVPKNCDASVQTVNSRTYNVLAMNNGGNATITTNSISISNGTITYAQTFSCNLGIVNTSGDEITNSPICDSGYSVSGNNCVPSNCNASTKTVNGHTYSVSESNHGDTLQVVSTSNSTSNGSIYFKNSFNCNYGNVTATGTETINNVTCESGYTAYYDGCEKSTLMNSIIGYWSFDEASGNYAKDKINNTNHLDLTNSNQYPGSWVTGKRSSSAYRFNGVGWLRTSGLLFAAPVKTISFWYKIPSTANYAGTVLSFEHSSNSNKEVNLGQNVNYYGLSTCAVYTSPHLISYGTPINDTNWHFMSFSLTSNAIICVDG
ncbi:MAG: type II secretion system protein, partial [Candidatus Absconditabacteria bacterium]